MNKLSSSLQNLQQLLTHQKEKPSRQQTSAMAKLVVQFLITFTNLLKSSDGRDRLCALIQYCSKFYGSCILYTLDIETKLDCDFLYTKFDTSKRIEKSMSAGRKIFRFLKFIEDIKQLYSFLFRTPNLIRILKALMCLSSFFYHLMDNVVWAVNVSIIDEYIIGEIRWKMTKKFFALLRKILLIFVDSIKLVRYLDKEQKLKENQSRISENGGISSAKLAIEKELDMLNENFEMRSKIRVKVLELIHSASRICMLSYSLKLEPFFSYTHPVYVAFCGIVYSGISIFRHYVKASDFSNILKPQRLNNKLRPARVSGRSLERIFIDDRNKAEILKENYFNNYYIDFNKDGCTK